MRLENIASTALIHDDVNLAENVIIGHGTIIYPNVTIGENSIIEPYCIIGQPPKNYYHDSNFEFSKTIIGKDSVVRTHSVIYAGSSFGDALQTGHHVLILPETTIGINCSVGSYSDLEGKLTIGNYTRIHSNVHIGQFSTIGNYIWIFPYVVFLNDPQPPVGKLKGPTIENYAIIATGAILYPAIHVGTKAVIGAASFVRHDVPSERLFLGNPARDLGPIQRVLDNSRKQVYPWMDKVDDYGYPWQKKESTK